MYTRLQRAKIVTVAFAGTVFDGADFTVFLFFLVPLSQRLHVSLLALSTVQASSYVIGIIGGVIFGRFADQRGRKLGLLATILVFSVFTLATTAVNSYAALFVVRVLAGIGIGGESGIAFAYVNEAFPGRDQRRGLASGLLQSMFLVGAWLAALIYRLTSTLGAEGWRAAFAILGGLGLLVAVSVLFIPESRVWLQRRSDAARAVSTHVRAASVGMMDLLRGALGRRFLIACALMTFTFYGAYAVYTFGPAMWQSTFHLDPKTVGTIGMASAILGGISYIGGGILADAVGRRRAYVVTTSIGVAAYLIFAIALYFTHAGGIGPSVIATMMPVYLLLQIGYGYFGVQGVWLSELFPTEVRTTAQNGVYYVGRAIGAGGAPIAGLWVSQRLGAGVPGAVALGIIGAVGALICCRFLPETRGDELPR